jgi:hypothetical protein
MIYFPERCSLREALVLIQLRIFSCFTGYTEVDVASGTLVQRYLGIAIIEVVLRVGPQCQYQALNLHLSRAIFVYPPNPNLLQTDKDFEISNRFYFTSIA